MAYQKYDKSVLISHYWSFIIIIILATTGITSAQSATAIHPTFPLLDQNGENVLSSHSPVSTMTTCGACHDTAYIESHSFHADLGLRDIGQPGNIEGERAWDISPGPFGRWDPILYRTLTPQGDALLDLGTPDWVRVFGARHPGGGPAVRSRSGDLIESLQAQPGDVETHVLNPATGEADTWDWDESGTVEMNCFLCHLPNPDNEARLEALHTGDLRWAATATLLRTGIVAKQGTGWQWNERGFSEVGHATRQHIRIQDPDDANCGQCHGVVETDLDEPIVLSEYSVGQLTTDLTGQVFSAQKLMNGGVNLAGKAELARAWDVHAERAVECVGCHFSLNNPIYQQEPDETRPEHLRFDARRMDLQEYLVKPSHQFAKGQSSQSLLSPELDASMRRCESCHDAETAHEWLPCRTRHFAAISCESCHIPKLFAPARQQTDWTVLTLEGQARIDYRGVQGQFGDASSLVTGYEPILLLRKDVSGKSRLTPYNLVTTWFWVYGDPERPVRLYDLKRAYLSDGAYRREVLVALDSNGDGVLSDTELVLDTIQKQQAIKHRLEALGLQNPRIRGEIQPYGLHHNVTHDRWVTRDCGSCHSEASRVNRPMALASIYPNDIRPEFVLHTNLDVSGDIRADQDALVYQPHSRRDNLYILGHDSVFWINWLGAAVMILVLIGVAVHGGLRMVAARKWEDEREEGTSKPPQTLTKVYMYGAYERTWHWLQAIAILVLILTGIAIHLPDAMELIPFRTAVRLHNIVGFTLLVNAFLAAFYHIAGGSIRQYIPEPGGFFSQVIEQAIYYMRGIFRGDPHPFGKAPERKLNPLQKITYLMTLNVLLPLQVVTGILVWGAQRWENISASLGGLGVLVPIHSLGAWLFVAFLIMHIYLTTTGHTPLGNVRAMILGWDEIEHAKRQESRTSALDTTMGENVGTFSDLPRGREMS